MVSYAIMEDSIEESDLLSMLKEGSNEKYFWYHFWTKTGILKRKKIDLYIGMTYGQTVSERLLNKHEVFKMLIREGIAFNMTFYAPLDKPRITKKDVSNVEKALIAHFKPEYNAQNRIYKGPSIKVEIYKSQTSYLDEGNSIEEIIWDG